jgi:hypothetical protein
LLLCSWFDSSAEACLPRPDGWTDVQTDIRTDGRTEGWTDVCSETALAMTS